MLQVFDHVKPCAVGGSSASRSRPSLERLKMRKGLVDVFPSFVWESALNASGLPWAFAGSRPCGDWRKLVPNSEGSRPSDNYSRMACAEGLFAGLTLSFLCINE